MLIFLLNKLKILSFVIVVTRECIYWFTDLKDIIENFENKWSSRPLMWETIEKNTLTSHDVY